MHDGVDRDLLLGLDLCVPQTMLLTEQRVGLKDHHDAVTPLPAWRPVATAGCLPGLDHPPGRGSPMRRLRPLLCVWRN